MSEVLDQIGYTFQAVFAKTQLLCELELILGSDGIFCEELTLHLALPFIYNVLNF